MAGPDCATAGLLVSGDRCASFQRERPQCGIPTGAAKASLPLREIEDCRASSVCLFRASRRWRRGCMCPACTGAGRWAGISAQVHTCCLQSLASAADVAQCGPLLPASGRSVCLAAGRVPAQVPAVMTSGMIAGEGSVRRILGLSDDAGWRRVPDCPLAFRRCPPLRGRGARRGAGCGGARRRVVAHDQHSYKSGIFQYGQRSNTDQRDP